MLEVTRLVRAEEDLPELLAAIARTISESLGYRTVVVNLFRPAWNDFTVTTVHGSDEARAALLGRVRTFADWQPLLADEFHVRGAYVVHAGAYDWGTTDYSYVPSVDPGAGADAWHPEDALFLPMRHSDGHLLGILSVDEPVTRRRPADEELDVLVSLADHAALAVQAAQESAEAAKHRLALEHLLDVSSRLTAEPVADEILRDVCRGVRDALGFEHVGAQLVHPATGVLEARAAVGWSIDGQAMRSSTRVTEVTPLLDPRFEIAGCFLLPGDEGARRITGDQTSYVSSRNGDGPRAWDHHWLLVPLRDAAGEVIGLIWADEPEDRLLPSEEKLQALRIFANQAAAAIVSAAQHHELRFLADHDPLTRLLNRRAFVERLDGEVARATRYKRSFALVLCDLDGFKELNDRFGHLAGDEALQLFARVLHEALRKPDDAFRIGGDEFALLLAEATDDDARAVVDRVTSMLADSEDERLSGLRASFGVASCPEDARDPQALFRLADEALYEAKRKGSGLQFVA
ncbi:MAG TPA: GGDEF domain-containing protein [Gaiellaceae bacterium]|nr:GGDEF domain-containing protein [Gaiellaceae bacterium]